MSPSSREINGPRPSPLKIHKDSHQIQKQSSSTSSSTATSATSGGAHQKQRHQPIIIYTHSPKVIHTQAQDFMALVQKLTGLSRSPADADADADATDDKKPETRPTNKALGRAHDTPPHPPPPPPSTAVDPTAELGFDLPQPASSFLLEIPLFTPSSADQFFCSPKSLYRFAEAKSFPEF